jgi:MFS superfamily sulfate permease-like transporter
MKLFSNLKQDIPSGLVVFLVALPLCLGIALASGAPFFSGMIAGIVGGIVVASISNSNLSVSGPAAGLAALVLAAITNLGAFDIFLCAVVIAGLLQTGMGLLKLGGVANYFPSSVIKGMLTSIGILIIAKQIPHACGYDRDEKGHLAQLFPFGDEDWHELLKPLHHIDLGVFIICLVSLAIIILWERPMIKKKVGFIPGALVAVFVAVIINQLFKMADSPLYANEDHLVQIPAPSSFNDFLGFFTFPDFTHFFDSNVIAAGIMIAIIASLETLLSIEAVDNLDPERNVTNTNRELIAQGIGNTVSGLIGGLPITSVIVRSSANVHSGAKSKMSAIFHGILLLLSVIVLPGIMNLIPLSALAAILLVTGFKLCKFSIFKQLWNQGKYQFVPFMVTVGVIIGIDLLGLYPPLKGEGLLIGVCAGIFAGIGAILLGNLKNSYFLREESKENNLVYTIKLSEEVSFLNKAAIKQTLDQLAHNSKVNIDASSTKYIDFDVLEIIKEFRDLKSKLRSIEVVLTGFKEEYNMESQAAPSGH